MKKNNDKELELLKNLADCTKIFYSSISCYFDEDVDDEICVSYYELIKIKRAISELDAYYNKGGTNGRL